MQIVVTDALQLKDLRESIDAIDAEILDLVGRRIALVIQIATFKRARELPVYDPERERAVIERLIGLAPPHLDARLVRRIFERIIDESRRVEQHPVP